LAGDGSLKDVEVESLAVIELIWSSLSTFSRQSTIYGIPNVSFSRETVIYGSISDPSPPIYDRFSAKPENRPPLGKTRKYGQKPVGEKSFFTHKRLIIQ
jgi:hypothetical protein